MRTTKEVAQDWINGVEKEENKKWFSEEEINDALAKVLEFCGDSSVTVMSVFLEKLELEEDNEF